MIEYLFGALGLDPSIVSSDFTAFAGTLIITICVFGVTKLIFVLLTDFFGGM